MSQNHFMLGAAEEWFYCPSRHPGGRFGQERIRIQPCFPEGVDWVDCRTLTPGGHVQGILGEKGRVYPGGGDAGKEERICLSLNGEEEIVKVQGSLEREVRVK